MAKTIHFQVDSRLAHLLSDTYRSTELALKELIDNAWDADAEHVSITLPKELTNQPIVIKDDGTGMTEQEINSQYLFVANDRRTRTGDRTPGKNRKVKGRKGIGKFAGLMSATTMLLETKTRGKAISFILDKNEIIKTGKDIENIPIEISSAKCNGDEHGTCVTLSNLNQSLNFPSPEKLIQILIHEYGRETDFNISVNGKPLDIEDISGKTVTEVIELPNVGKVKLHFTISDAKKPLKNAGIIVTVGGKTIGKPQFFGLDEADDFPSKLLGKIYGAVEVDGLFNDVTADWGAIIENSKGFNQVKDWIKPKLHEEVKNVYGREVKLAHARLQQKINKRLELLPENKRLFADKAIKKILQKLYGEKEERLEPIVSVILDAVERDDYYYVLEQIDNARDSDVAIFAEALEAFGITELALMSRQATERLRYLDYLDNLISNPGTLEKNVHKALENSLWIFGVEYSLMSSDKTLKRVVNEYLNEKYKGDNATKRPDLLLSCNVNRFHLLIEFKRPSHAITYKDYQQATLYRNELSPYLSSDINIKIMVIGGSRNYINENYSERDIDILTFNDIVSNARNELNWLLKELQQH